MTAKEFISWAEGYYGEYPEGQMRDIMSYLAPWEPTYLDALQKVLKVNYSSQFKTPPDIAAMTKLYPQASAEQERTIHRVESRALPSMNETDAEKAARLHADMDSCGVTMQTPGWFKTVLQYRIDRGDYGPNYRIGPKPKLQEYK